jgi:hypothetical protein
MDRTPQPIVTDVVEPLGQPMRQTATAARMGGQGHGLPTLVLGVLVAAAHLPISDGEEAVGGQRDPVDIPAQVLQDWLRAVHGRLTGDDPPVGPARLGQGQVGTFLTHHIETPPATARREGLDGHQGGRAGGPPRGAAQPVVQVFLVAADKLPQGLGPGQDDMNGGDWSECLPPLCQPDLGVMTVALGATPGAAGVVDLGLLTAVITRPQGSAPGLGPAVDHIRPRAARAGQEIRAKPLLIGGTIAPKDVRHRWQARAPAR